MLLYFISDFHFGHKNIITYCNRPFANSDEMDKTLIHNFLHKVPEGETCYILGDIFNPILLGAFQNRHLVIILGNHDRRKKSEEAIYNAISTFYLDCEVYKVPILIKKFIWLSHEPLECMVPESPYLNIHGHVHNDKNFDNSKKWYDGGRRFNVSCEMINYTPISLEEIVDNLGIDKNL